MPLGRCAAAASCVNQARSKGEDDGLDSLGGVEHGIADINAGFPRDAADLILAHGEGAPRQGLAHIHAIGQVEGDAQRHGTTEDLTVRRDDAEVGIVGILRQQAGEPGMAHIWVSARESGHVSQPGKELACAFSRCW